ncbi:uncharacterized skeletal organic matrix protein 5-like [Stylophora pistillata]|nr:uncharacterized skeletal organic matrix protein 5-like [Stylophora pistillata]
MGQTCDEDIDECAYGTYTCNADAVCNNTKGSYRCTCKPGYNGDGNVCNTASTCKEAFERHGSMTSGVYTLTFGLQKIPVYCHMGNFGCGDGGWTMAIKIDGSKSTFHYDSHLWSDKNTHNITGGKTGFDLQETKLQTYWNTSFSRVCLGMKIGNQTNFIVIQKEASSLFSLIADGQYRNTLLGKNTWKTLIGKNVSLQHLCDKEGFNVHGDTRYSKARIGIIANSENECRSCNSRIGFGTGGLPEGSNTCGNEANHKSDNGEKHTKAMGYILVQ